MSVNFLFDTKGFHCLTCLDVESIWISNEGLFIWIQTNHEAFCIHQRTEGVALLLWAFKAKDGWFLWLADPGASVISLWEVRPHKTTAYSEVVLSKPSSRQGKGCWINQDKTTLQISHCWTFFTNSSPLNADILCFLPIKRLQSLYSWTRSLFHWSPRSPRPLTIGAWGPTVKWHFTSWKREREEMMEGALKGSLSFPRAS